MEIVWSVTEVNFRKYLRKCLTWTQPSVFSFMNNVKKVRASV